MKTLIVDDDFVSRTKMRTIMENYGQCDAAEGGVAAIAAFREAYDNDAPFDLITLDIEMPEMDGTTVLVNIRKIETEKDVSAEKKVKILMVTAQSDKDSVVKSLQAGCNDYIVKPFDMETVNVKLQKMGLVTSD